MASTENPGELFKYPNDLGGIDQALSVAAIDEGLDDIRHGRTISLEDYCRTRGL